MNKLHPLAVRPVDQMEPLYKAECGTSPAAVAHNAFAGRMAFHNFDRDGLAFVRNTLERALRIDPADAQLAYELAAVIAQNKPTYATLATALDLLLSVFRDEGEISQVLLADARKLDARIRHALGLRRTEAHAPNVIRRVNWAVNNECPMVCVGCFNTFTPSVLTLSQTLVGLDRLAAAGVQGLVVSGGDPMLWPDLVAFAKHARDRGLRVGVDVTGHHFPNDLVANLAPHVDYIGLPFDGATPATQSTFRKFRDRDHFALFERAVALSIANRVRVKVNTVVSAQNVHELFAIGQRVSSNPATRDWSLFQWWPLRATPEMIGRMMISDTRFREAITPLRGAFPSLTIRTRAVAERSGTHFMVQANGQVVTFGPSVGDEILLGHILEDDIITMMNSPLIVPTTLKRYPLTRFLDPPPSGIE